MYPAADLPVEDEVMVACNSDDLGRRNPVEPGRKNGREPLARARRVGLHLKRQQVACENEHVAGIDLGKHTMQIACAPHNRRIGLVGHQQIIESWPDGRARSVARNPSKL